MTDFNFDMQTAWWRRFSSDAAGNLGAFALRLKEALPDRVTLEKKRGLFAKTDRITAVNVELGQNIYRLAVDKDRLSATVTLIVRGITLNTRAIDPLEWFAKLAEETNEATTHAKLLSESLQRFMES